MTPYNLDLKDTSPVHILYHADCLDGLGSAAIAEGYFLGCNIVPVLHPVQYGSVVPLIPEGARVFILDFSYDKETLSMLSESSKELYVVDHHKTAEEELRDIPYAYFDMNHSGAYLTWRFFYDGIPVPRVILNIQDRDLWKFELKDTKSVCSGLYLKLEKFKSPVDLLRSDVDELRVAGDTVQEFIMSIVRRQLLNSHVVNWSKDGLLFGRTSILNTTFSISESCHEMLKQEDVKIAICWFKDGTNYIYSLRSRPDGPDVSDIAKRFGGGGHPNAAGFRSKFLLF